MQPHSRQVPPSACCFSTTATFSPSCAARIAATYPPVPAPMMITSYSLGTGSSRVPRSSEWPGQRGGGGLTWQPAAAVHDRFNEDNGTKAVAAPELPAPASAGSAAGG